MKLDRELLRGFSKHRASSAALIGANLVPLLGVIFLGWDAFAIIALYWSENVVIGAINVLKMITCSPDERAIDWSKLGTSEQVADLQRKFEGQGGPLESAKLAHHGSKLFFVPFFIFHYGMFCMVHGIFVFAMFGNDRMSGGFGPFGLLTEVGQVFSQHHLWWGVAALAASHLYSYVVNYLFQGEYRRTFVPMLMAAPYARVVVLHIAILFGGWVVMALGSNLGTLVLLIAGKTLLDLSLHVREHERIDEAEPAISPGTVLEENPEPLAIPKASER